MHNLKDAMINDTQHDTSEVGGDICVTVLSMRAPQGPWGVAAPRLTARRSQASPRNKVDSAVIETAVADACRLPDPEEPALRAKATVLVVDDDADACLNISDIFIDCGYRVDMAHEGHAALQLAKQQAYDVALFDLKMPGMDGLTLCREVRRLCPAIAAFLITGYPEDVEFANARAAGIRLVLSKPVDVSQLLLRVDEALLR